MNEQSEQTRPVPRHFFIKRGAGKHIEFPSYPLESGEKAVFGFNSAEWMHHFNTPEVVESGCKPTLMDDEHVVAFLRSVLDAGTQHLLIFDPVAVDLPNRFSVPGIPIERALECLALSASEGGEEKLPQLPVEIYHVDLGDDFEQLSNVQHGENALNTSAEPTIILPRTFLVTFDDDENVTWSETPTTDGKRTHPSVFE